MILKPDPIFDVYEGESPVNWAGMSPRPILAILRASAKFFDGVRRKDYQVENYAAQCRALNIPVGLYHFLLPNNIAEQAQLFLSVWNKVGADIPPIADVECYPDLYNVGRDAWGSQVKVFLDLIEQGTGQKPIIYSSENYWAETYSSIPPTWADGYGHWVAWYPFLPDNFDTLPVSTLPKGWTHWEMWQYNDKGRSNGLLANDLNIASEEFKKTLGVASEPEAYIVSRPLSEVSLELTPSSNSVLPLKTPLQQALEYGWDVAMNCGAGFDYVHPEDITASVAGFSAAKGVVYSTEKSWTTLYVSKDGTIRDTEPANVWTAIPYARRMMSGGIINYQLGTIERAPWSMIGFGDESVYFIVTTGLEGSSGMTQLDAAQWAWNKGITDLYLFDSGHSTGIVELDGDGDPTLLYSAYGEAVPQCIGLKAKTVSGGTMRGVAKAVTNIKAVTSGQVPAVSQLQVGQWVYGTLVGDAKTGDLTGFSHFYKSDGTKVELGCVCKAYAGNLIVSNEAEPGTPPPPPAGEVWHLHQTLTSSSGVTIVFDCDGVKQ